MRNLQHKIRVAEFITDQLKITSKTSNEISIDIGLGHPGALAMIAEGTVKLPIGRVSALAEALGTDSNHLLRLVLSEYVPDVLPVIENMFQCRLLSANEAALIEGFRAVTGNRNTRGAVVERDGLLEVLW